MKILVGHTRGDKARLELAALGWGRMMVERRPDPYPGEPWGFDNGAFLYWRQNKPFDTELYLERLGRAGSAESAPYMAIVPDIVAGGIRSLEFSLNWLHSLKRDFPNWSWYLAVQDGMQIDDVVPVLHKFSGLFLGGTDRFKQREAQQWAELAHAARKLFHYGRAGTLRKLRHARAVEADSVDSAFILWQRGRFAQFVEEWKQGQRQEQPYLVADAQFAMDLIFS